MKATSDELWALVRVIDASDPVWESCTTLIAPAAKLCAMFDLSAGVPFGWRLLKGKRARRWLRDSIRDEQRFQRDQRAREKARDN